MVSWRLSVQKDGVSRGFGFAEFKTPEGLELGFSWLGTVRCLGMHGMHTNLGIDGIA